MHSLGTEDSFFSSRSVRTSDYCVLPFTVSGTTDAVNAPCLSHGSRKVLGCSQQPSEEECTREKLRTTSQTSEPTSKNGSVQVRGKSTRNPATFQQTQWLHVIVDQLRGSK